MAKKQEDGTEQAEAKPIRLAYVGEGSAGDTLTIGEAHYDVVDNIVHVAPEHLEAALQAGFKPA